MSLEQRHRYVNRRLVAYLSRTTAATAPYILYALIDSVIVVVSRYITYPFYYAYVSFMYKVFVRVDERVTTKTMMRYEGGEIQHDNRFKRRARQR